MNTRKASLFSLLCALSAAILPAHEAAALPKDWAQFMQCTREFSPSRPHTAGHFETIVTANRVIEKCYVVLPPPDVIQTPGEFGPIRPSPGEGQTPEDIACDKIDGAISDSQSHLQDLRHQRTSLTQAISNAESALQINQEVTTGLYNDYLAHDNQCKIKTDAYMSAIKAQISKLKSTCTRLKGQKAIDCMDDIETEAELAPLVSSANQARETACNLSFAALNRVTHSTSISAALRNDLAKWNNQLKLFNSAISREMVRIGQLNARKRECNL